MTTRVYEGLFILDSDQYARNPEEVSGQIDRFINDFDGEVLVSRLYEERKLTYPIKGHKRGTYWLTYFKLDASKVKDLKRQYEISDSVIRFLFVKVDPRLVEMLVEHAKAGPIRPIVDVSVEESEQPIEVVEASEIVEVADESNEEALDNP